MVIVEKFALNFTDLLGTQTGCTSMGSNKFWTGWVEDLGNGLANFECRWGPTGTPGSDKGSVRNIPLALALKTLLAKASEKRKKGYTQLEVRSIAEETAKAAAKGINLTQAAPTSAPAAVVNSRTFHPKVEQLLGAIYGATSNVVRLGLSAQAGATADNPIGNLSDAQLDLGGSILDEIGVYLKQLGSKVNPVDPRLVDLTNRYLSNVPRSIPAAHRGRANIHHVVVSSEDRLKEQQTFLQLLRDAHLARATFHAAAHAGPAVGAKTAVWYDGLGCDLDYCEPGSVDFRQVNEIFTTGQSRKNANFYNSGVRLVGVWKIARKGTEAAYKAYRDAHVTKPGAVGEIFAWHGTRTENLLGISKNGLLMPENLPKGVHISGKAFGKGVYHAPAWTATGITSVAGYRTDGTNGAFKSLNYTSINGASYGSGNTGNTAYMYLQNVALGVPEVHRSACWDKYRPNNFPHVDHIYANADQGTFLAHDEIVTFNENAQTFRYLCEFAR